MKKNTDDNTVTSHLLIRYLGNPFDSRYHVSKNFLDNIRLTGPRGIQKYVSGLKNIPSDALQIMLAKCFYDNGNEKEAEKILSNPSAFIFLDIPPDEGKSFILKLMSRQRDCLDTITSTFGGCSELRREFLGQLWNGLFTENILNFVDLRNDLLNRRFVITGESGTGKEVAAQIISKGTGHVLRPFIVHKAETFESDFFGHKKGSFTGAISDHKGYALKYINDAIFIDEFGHIPPENQDKLLRFFQFGEITRLGETEPGKFRGVIIAATSRYEITENNKLKPRENKRATAPIDIDNRFDVYLSIPPLSEREEDIPGILRLHYKDNKMTDLIESFSDKYKGYDWTDRNVHGLLTEFKKYISEKSVLSYYGLARGGEKKSRNNQISFSGGLPDMTLNDFKASCLKHYIQVKYNESGRNISKTASLLKCSENTVKKYLKNE